MAPRQIDFHFHTERAKAELEVARRATSAAAATAHLTLSRLHVEKLRTIDIDAVAA